MAQDLGAVSFRVFLAFALALSGGVISSLTPMTHSKLCRLISFAAGTLLGVTLFSIIPEIYYALPVWQLVLGLASGYVLFWLISRYVFHVCPACAASHFDEATTHRFSEIATAMVIALGLHSTMDGLALALSRESNLSGGLDLSLLLAICVHKVPEGLALCALLLAAGLGRWKALIWVAAVEATTLLGGAFGLWAAPQIAGRWLDTVIAHVGGGFIFLAIHAVFGELMKHSRARVLANFAAGIVLIAALNFVLRYL
ncbi:MAG TPA: ZIP family metal transporter [Acidobacteriota bacterium]|nr:ZIP family metal transporter [Acidobacteriota bacterium]